MKYDVITFRLCGENEIRGDASWQGEDGALILSNFQLFRSSFVKDGKDCKLQSEVERVLKEFHRSRKPIGYVSFGHCSIYQC